jgi:hypothetical protein
VFRGAAGPFRQLSQSDFRLIRHIGEKFLSYSSRFRSGANINIVLYNIYPHLSKPYPDSASSSRTPEP